MMFLDICIMTMVAIIAEDKCSQVTRKYVRIVYYAGMVMAILFLVPEVLREFDIN